jgi:hypothetical protein
MMGYFESRTNPVPHVSQRRSCRLSNIPMVDGCNSDKTPEYHRNPEESQGQSFGDSTSFPALWMVIGSLSLWPRRSIVERALPILSCEDAAVTRFATQERSCAILPWICNPLKPRGRTTACRNGCVPATFVKTGEKSDISVAVATPFQ